MNDMDKTNEQWIQALRDRIVELENKVEQQKKIINMLLTMGKIGDE